MTFGRVGARRDANPRPPHTRTLSRGYAPNRARFAVAIGERNFKPCLDAAPTQIIVGFSMRSSA